MPATLVSPPPQTKPGDAPVCAINSDSSNCIYDGTMFEVTTDTEPVTTVTLCGYHLDAGIVTLITGDETATIKVLDVPLTCWNETGDEPCSNRQELVVISPAGRVPVCKEHALANFLVYLDEYPETRLERSLV